MSSPLVSVVIPNYNHASFLDERIQSVLSQTYQNMEVIILDDCSTDGSVTIIRKYEGHPKVSHVVVNSQNGGSAFKQWHKGFELAKGNLIWIAESDDSCECQMLERLVNRIEEHQAVMAFCKSVKYFCDGKKTHYDHQDLLTEDVIMAGRDFIQKYMCGQNSVANASAVVFDKATALRLPLQYMAMCAEGDWLFWMELMSKGMVCFVNEEYNYFRIHDSNTTNRLWSMGVTDMEHKTVFDYLVREGYVSFRARWGQKMATIETYRHREYASPDINKMVLRHWDRYGLYRLGIRFLPLFRSMRRVSRQIECCICRH